MNGQFSDLVGLIDQTLLGAAMKRMTDRRESERKQKVTEIKNKMREYRRRLRDLQAKLDEQANRNP